MVFPVAGAIGGMLASRFGFSLAGGARGVAGRFLRSPIVQGGQFGYGYTTASYLGYGASNTADPFGIHKPKYQNVTAKIGYMPYGSYGRRRYSRYSGYRRYGRSSYYRRRRPYYKRRYY